MLAINFLIATFSVVLATATEENCHLMNDECFPIEGNELSQVFSKFSNEYKVQSLNEYARKNNFLKKKLEFRHTPGRGFGLFALEKIKKGLNFVQIEHQDVQQLN